MSPHATICISNYFSSSKACVAWWAAYHEPARWIDKKLCLAIYPAVADWFYDLVNHFFTKLTHADVRGMLCRNDDGVYAFWHSILIDNRNLGLSVWADPTELFFLSYPCKAHRKLVCDRDRQRHQL